MKILVDFLPIVLFFIVYKFTDLYVATGVAVVVALVQLAVIFAHTRQLNKMLLASTLIIVLLGGATLVLHNDQFIKWKPTIIHWVFGLFFLFSPMVTKKPLIQHLLEKNLSLPDTAWKTLNHAWIAFFTVVGLLNLYVVYHFNTDAWVNFKLFGVLGLTIIFALAQAFYISKKEDPHDACKSRRTR